ncbi:MAG TPA: FKBP-type peptidyl-prolyl cis-trans isomerase, partial [Solirubrobacterales bacterium]
SATTEQVDVSASTDQGDSTAPKRKEPVVNVPDARPPKDLVVKDIVKGDGEEVEDGDTILVDYVGVYYESGREFENSWADVVFKERYVMGSGEMIDGWKKGLEGMKVGGRRELIIPPDQAFDSYPVIYVVDLRGIE